MYQLTKPQGEGVSSGTAVSMAFREPPGSLRVTDHAPQRATAAQEVEHTAATGPSHCGWCQRARLWVLHRHGPRTGMGNGEVKLWGSGGVSVAYKAPPQPLSHLLAVPSFFLERDKEKGN